MCVLLFQQKKEIRIIKFCFASSISMPILQERLNLQKLVCPRVVKTVRTGTGSIQSMGNISKKQKRTMILPISFAEY
jgi:hypothetical protein